MTFWATVAGMLAVTFGSRYAGLALPPALPDFWVRCLHFVPIAVFAALVTPSLEGELGEGEIRLAAAGVTTLVAWRTRNLGVAIASGMLAFWALRWLRRDGVRLAEQPAEPLALDRARGRRRQYAAEPVGHRAEQRRRR